MTWRRVVVDSDDDIDDFPSLRPPPTTAPKKTAQTRTPAPARTPKPSRSATSGEAATAAAEDKGTTTVRRRKLGRLDNDHALLRRLGAEESSKPDSKARRNRLANIDTPPTESPASTAVTTGRRPRPRVELRTRKTRRISELPADDAGELSTEEVSVLEDVAYGRNNGKGTNGRDEDVNDDDGDDGTIERDENSESECESECDGDTSEFHDSSLEEDDLSFASLGDFFSRSPTKRPIVSNHKTLRQTAQDDAVPRKKDGRAVPSRATPASFVEEGSSIFYSAEESLSDSLAKPLSQLSLDHPPSKPGARKTTKLSPPASSSSVRPATPPPDNPASERPAGLVSPTKKLPRIPQTPHRPSTDAFWNQLVVDDWNMAHSPRKLLFDPDTAKTNRHRQGGAAGGRDDATPAASSSPSKKSRAAVATDKAAKKQFQQAKHALAEQFLAELDTTITQGALARLAEATGGVRIVWSNKLNTTAGRANWRRETLRPRPGAAGATAAPASTSDVTAGSAASEKDVAVRIRHHASIELAEKVIDDADRLRNVVAHEFCHLATFMVSGVTGNPHGREFKAWAAQCARHFGHRGVQVTTKHAYAIAFKYAWACTGCGAAYQRHSKSIDPGRHRCGACQGLLRQTKPVPRGWAATAAAGAGTKTAASTTGGGGVASAPTPSAYQQFMKTHMAAVRRDNPNSPQKEIMKLVAEKWTRAKAQTAQTAQTKGTAGATVDRLDKAFVDLTLD
ncbi:hypothetical protein SPI_05850 [Niveomyces insectorum RCEF 264]|uniref:SprT-like domain-containing protein n=1 Tax=Niveomyces insectorum RCEF 264 TaxID=1081102 RepID=A0A167SID2_9HYPO|nr:hypothetical protein SPI_05850 [Niveomyces insectorum RCEF 264]